MRFWCTINTDASFSKIYKVGAFAFWIRHDQGRLTQSGPLKKCTSSLDAEIQAIGNGLYGLLKSNFTDIEYIIVNTDCTYAIDAIMHNQLRNAPRQSVKRVISIMGELSQHFKPQLKKRKKPFIEMRYVPAHVDTSTQKGYINDWADKEAKKHIGKLINEIKNDEQRVS